VQTIYPNLMQKTLQYSSLMTLLGDRNIIMF
jgi:hypothetical protein